MSRSQGAGQQRRRMRILLAVFIAMVFGQASWAQELYQRAAWTADIPPGPHSVEALVTVVDERTLQVEHFTYDGTAPLVYFYLGESNENEAFENGLQLEPLLDRAYDDESMTLNLPEGETLDGYNAISVWCAEFSVNFGSASFTAPAAMYQRAGWVADIPFGQHFVQGQATIITDRIIHVEHFYYDGSAPLVYFYLGVVDNDTAFENGLQVPPELDRLYQDESLVLLLPEGATLDGYGAISVWCVEFSVNFSSASFIAPDPTAVADAGWDANAVVLEPPVPNPLLTNSSIRFHLRRDGPVVLSVHDLSGRRVASLAEGTLTAGDHQVVWNGRDGNSRRVSPGVYFIRSAVAGDVVMRRVAVLR
ncbi:DM13 domain-containing protein [Candidatus Eisenbacteria bacterium]|uniref:DM13 domain-containing protein n=1 Tax=Eiseniibacteriota bacterium TaxID=2212470 RepID=A0ABV6YKT7_UNCEI